MDVKGKKRKTREKISKIQNAHKVQQLFWHINTQERFSGGLATVCEAAAQDETEKWRLTARGMGLELRGGGLGVWAWLATTAAVSAAVERVNTRQ